MCVTVFRSRDVASTRLSLMDHVEISMYTFFMVCGNMPHHYGLAIQKLSARNHTFERSSMK
jgi:hypothetical protein